MPLTLPVVYEKIPINATASPSIFTRNPLNLEYAWNKRKSYNASFVIFTIILFSFTTFVSFSTILI